MTEGLEHSETDIEERAQAIVEAYQRPVLVYLPGSPTPQIRELPAAGPKTVNAWLRSMIGSDQIFRLLLGNGICMWHAARDALPDAEPNLGARTVVRGVGGDLRPPPLGPVVVGRTDSADLAPIQVMQLRIVLDAERLEAEQGPFTEGRSWSRWTLQGTDMARWRMPWSVGGRTSDSSRAASGRWWWGGRARGRVRFNPTGLLESRPRTVSLTGHGAVAVQLNRSAWRGNLVSRCTAGRCHATRRGTDHRAFRPL
ncbi:hypothetical protein [Glycomyces harbinensis]|uniref:Uncharacterized protein n=1 Tax=Glycomyces harbinensis TaxID=58114 RepID=A0A1G6YD21_9ACTN|nr:hypothetical protein [Glycomyces harbinensis]SDD87486.1 hypothetical protein SAMN05216270_108232 [Glycomyces harbinensis]